ncbi:MAG: glycoside hydrolase family 15 protein [Pseudomonadales bacterium]
MVPNLPPGAAAERPGEAASPAEEQPYTPIGEYGAIGDGRSVALISCEGSIDWLCLPYFSAPSIFAALLDTRRGGRFRVCPTAPFRAEQRYVADTNVLETKFSTDSGSVVLTDCMAVLPQEKHYDELRPQAELLRLISGCEGTVELQLICEPRPDFARGKGMFEDRGRLGWAYCFGDQVMFLQAEMILNRSNAGTVQGIARVEAGQTLCCSLAYTRRDIAVVPLLGVDAVRRVEETVQWWRDWSNSCVVEGLYRHEIIRSALVLKMLTYDLSGALVAAPTSSLPEEVGGMRNWDYRYCWLRDAAMTLQAFMDLGYTREADFFIDWLLHATRLSWPRLDVLYDVFGETRLAERELTDLEGYRGSYPARVGNGACGQLQLDVYGSVVDAAYTFVQRGGELDFSEARLLAGFGRQVCKLWNRPDEGIWEERGDRTHHTYSKIMCWVALDRLLKLADQGFVRVPAKRFRHERAAIEAAVENEGFNPSVNSYVAEFGGAKPDATLLLAARYGYRAADHPRMRGTYDFIEKHLAAGELVYRYPPGSDGLPGGEGAFGIASFWRVEYLALAGRMEEAKAAFERLLGRANHIGLYAEEIDPESGEALGNFPQAFTHVGLITAAVALRRADEKRPSS